MHHQFDSLDDENFERLEKSRELLDAFMKDVDGEIRLSFSKEEWY